VMGVNDDKLTAAHTICTAASCTTNCLAPVVKVIHENLVIEKGMITTIHNITGTQALVDQTDTGKKQDLRRGRCVIWCLGSRVYGLGFREEAGSEEGQVRHLVLRVWGSVCKF